MKIYYLIIFLALLGMTTEGVAFSGPPTLKITGPSTLEHGGSAENFQVSITGVRLDSYAGVSNFKMYWTFLGGGSITTHLSSTPVPGHTSDEVSYYYTKNYSVPGSSTAFGDKILRVHATWIDSNGDYQSLTDTHTVSIVSYFPIDDPSDGPSDDLADLRTIITSCPSSITQGTGNFSFTATIGNIGEETTGSNKSAVYLLEPGESVGSSTLLKTFNSGLQPNESKSETTFIGVSGFVAGPGYKLVMVADYLDVVDESNESNNTATCTFEIKRPSLPGFDNPLETNMDEIISIMDLNGNQVWNQSEGTPLNMETLPKEEVLIFDYNQDGKIEKQKKYIR